MHNKFNKDLPSTETYITTIVERETCGPHKAQRGFPCWVLENSFGYFLQGVCNKRAKKAGFNHPVSEKSLRSHRPPSRPYHKK